MGAYRINVDLHDDETEQFVMETLTTDLTTLDREEIVIYQHKARYIAQRLVDENQALADSVERLKAEAIDEPSRRVAASMRKRSRG